MSVVGSGIAPCPFSPNTVIPNSAEEPELHWLHIPDDVNIDSAAM
jgi:hypothetical protein